MFLISAFWESYITFLGNSFHWQVKVFLNDLMWMTGPILTKDFLKAISVDQAK